MPMRNTAGCINHPGVEASARCRQCGKPVCTPCVIPGAGGAYCSDICRDKHEQFLRQARDLDLERGVRRGIFVRLRQWVSTLIVFAALALMLGVLGTVFYVPVITEITLKVREVLGV